MELKDKKNAAEKTDAVETFLDDIKRRVKSKRLLRGKNPSDRWGCKRMHTIRNAQRKRSLQRYEIHNANILEDINDNFIDPNHFNPFMERHKRVCQKQKGSSSR